ncbi:hypothetical protein [Pseudomonas sp. dw_358]|uniref:hypothetical protein n=1 Tax=Pseudomonas sp. dw_358 TaxID=2720083 RepID=UPI001BD39DFA|nr:hypothetical protein [Pseudomonas sp. dw_358]
MHKFPLGLLGLCLSLGGCVGHNMTSTRAGGPTRVLSSEKPALRVAECVEFSWQNDAMFGIDANAYLNKGADGVLTVYTREAAYLADVKAAGAGASITFYAPAQSSEVTGKRLAALATCL